MLSTRYMYLPFSIVLDPADFFKSQLPEIHKIKQMVDRIKIMFKLPSDRVILSVTEGERIYKLTLLTKDIHKYEFGAIYYMPLEKRLDIVDQGAPLIQWKNKKVVYRGYSMLLNMVGMDKLFDKLVNVL